MIKGAKGESVEEPDDLDKKLSLIDARLKNISKTIEEFRTEENVLKFYDVSIYRLSEKLSERCQKFEKYYRHSQYRIVIGNFSMATTEDKVIERSRDFLRNKMSSVKLHYEYRSFNQAGIDGFGVSLEIRIEFDDTRIRIINTEGKNSLVKYYGEDLSDDEIDKIVNYETNRHTQILKEKIEYFEKTRTKND